MRLDHLNGSAPPKLAPELKFRNSIFFQQITFLTLFYVRQQYLHSMYVGADYQMRFRNAILPIVIRIITICRSKLIRTDPFRSWKIGLSSFESKHFDIFWWIFGGSFAYCFQSSSIFEFWNETLVKYFYLKKKVIFSYSKDYLEISNKKFVNLTYQTFWQ